MGAGGHPDDLGSGGQPDLHLLHRELQCLCVLRLPAGGGVSGDLPVHGAAAAPLGQDAQVHCHLLPDHDLPDRGVRAGALLCRPGRRGVSADRELHALPPPAQPAVCLCLLCPAGTGAKAACAVRSAGAGSHDALWLCGPLGQLPAAHHRALPVPAGLSADHPADGAVVRGHPGHEPALCLACLAAGRELPQRGIPAFAQAARVASSQTLACTSPMWALPSSSMHRRLWPMPPPMV